MSSAQQNGLAGRPVRVLVIGAGARGEIYSRYALAHPDLMQVVAVAEPRDVYRQQFVEQHAIAADKVFTDWRQAADAGKLADAVLICTQDTLHLEPALAFAKQGYAMLLEKPLSPDASECRTIVEEVVRQKLIFSVGHVLRYTRYTQKLKQLLRDNVIGDIVSLQHLEPVGYWHQAHSFVRGNWRNDNEAAFMLLQKSCHDIDWIRYIMELPCEQISSFGGLRHFRQENQPAGAADNCLDCAVEASCPYSAKRIYLGDDHKATPGFLRVLTPEVSQSHLQAALRDGQYGRCVYRCDNNVVDHQVVNMQFAGGRTASFTMTAFTRLEDRQTRIFGSHGCLEGDGRYIRITSFVDDSKKVYDVDEAEDLHAMSGHGGGDYYLMQHFIDAIRTNDPSQVLSGPAETLESHLMVFAAERARRESAVITLSGA
ncbi:Inositol 2-dehydrogenase/D-chiro-inositol 3-dehydrogenase [Serratia quinivorans]|uniref:Gfo/Idh/MocA family protein n=1 Tax=Serratia quinivorans TaxID=137545 RepID=UPI00217B99C5|nr:Gfo/Idh/MocA family oxidoreductase [Serratia quinivorans]CAI1774389.1 Inositol 2-dehydrogenase/D-chiro-inositol 3-dehydrogenase [Serratia quinivorans]